MSKGAETRERILDRALRLASREGLEGLTIGNLATELEMSKSGLFAHFGSKEELQLQVLRHATEIYREVVLRPALKAPRGVPRLRALFDRWLVWEEDPRLPGGCIFVQAATELDDRPGLPRDLLAQSQRELFAMLSRAAALAIEAGHFRPDLDAAQFAFELNSIILGFHHSRRLMRDEMAETRARAAFERLLAASAA
jgi:AcrR family transcriptional regulator